MPDDYTIFAALAAIWAFEPGNNGLYFVIRTRREGVPAVLPIALGTALFNAFAMLLILFGLTGLGDIGWGAHVLKTIIALVVIWLVGLNLFNLYNIRKAAGMHVTPRPEKLTPKLFFSKFGTGLAWGAMNPVNLAIFALIVPATQTNAISPEMLGTYTLTLLGINLAGLAWFVLGARFAQKLYRIAWVQAPLHIAGRGAFIAWAVMTIMTAGRVIYESLTG